jgi:hypothetical protein
MVSQAYRVLFRLSLRHTFYTDGVCEDFVAEPTPACRTVLDRYGLIFKRADDGFVVVAPLAPQDPDALRLPFGPDVPVFAFLLRLTNPYLLNVSDVDEPTPGETVFYFNNLRDDQADGRRLLGDSVAAARVGPARRLVDKTSYTHPFDSPVSSAEMILRDPFGTERGRFTFDMGSETVEGHTVNLATFPPGFYTMEDDHGGSEAFYYDPGLYGNAPFAVVEVFTDPARVPVAYQFIDTNEALSDQGDYAIEMLARATTWQYVVIRKYDPLFELDRLAITGDLTFTRTLDTDAATFTSDPPSPGVPSSAARRTVTLVLEPNGGGTQETPIRALPNPGIKHVLQEGINPGSYQSTMYIYV